MLGVDIGNYTFDASAQTITITGIKTLGIAEILSVVNVTDQVTIYSATDEDAGGTITANVLTLEYNTTSMDDADNLQIFVHYNNDKDFNL